MKLLKTYIPVEVKTSKNLKALQRHKRQQRQQGITFDGGRAGSGQENRKSSSGREPGVDLYVQPNAHTSYKNQLWLRHFPVKK
jgi:hypothetical protein